MSNISIESTILSTLILFIQLNFSCIEQGKQNDESNSNKHLQRRKNKLFPIDFFHKSNFSRMVIP